MNEGWRAEGKGVWRSVPRGGRRGMPFSQRLSVEEMRRLGKIGGHQLMQHEQEQHCLFYIPKEVVTL